MRNLSCGINRRSTADFVAAVSVFSCCSMISPAIASNGDLLILSLACEPADLCWRDDLSVLASCENSGESITIDLYLAVVLPSGDVFYFPDGSLSAPFMSSVMIPESASFCDVEVFSGEMRPGLDAGEYLWVFAATSPGTLDVLAYTADSMRLGYDCWRSYSNLNCVSALAVSGSDLFIGLAKGGVVRYDLGTGHYERYVVSDGLASSEVNHFCLDDEGNVWAALGQGQRDMDFFDEWGGISVFSNLEWTPYYPEKRSRSRNGFRDSNMFCNIAYSSADEAAYAVSHTGHIVRLGSDGTITYVHEENNPYAQCVFAHPDGSIYACFGADEIPESRTYISRYSEGEWTEIADGGGHHCYITSDGTVCRGF